MNGKEVVKEANAFGAFTLAPKPQVRVFLEPVDGAPALVEARRRDFLAERPGAEEKAQKHFVRAKVARAMGNEPAAKTEYEAALAADPLNLAIHQAYWNLTRQGAGADASR